MGKSLPTCRSACREKGKPAVNERVLKPGSQPSTMSFGSGSPKDASYLFFYPLFMFSTLETKKGFIQDWQRRLNFQNMEINLRQKISGVDFGCVKLLSCLFVCFDEEMQKRSGKAVTVFKKNGKQLF